MGKVVIEKWQCDRCGCVEDKRPRVMPKVSITVISEGEWAGGAVINWQEMCAPCTRIVEDAAEALHPTKGTANG